MWVQLLIFIHENPLNEQFYKSDNFYLVQTGKAIRINFYAYACVKVEENIVFHPLE